MYMLICFVSDKRLHVFTKLTTFKSGDTGPRAFVLSIILAWEASQPYPRGSPKHAHGPAGNSKPHSEKGERFEAVWVHKGGSSSVPQQVVWCNKYG